MYVMSLATEADPLHFYRGWTKYQVEPFNETS